MKDRIVTCVPTKRAQPCRRQQRIHLKSSGHWEAPRRGSQPSDKSQANHETDICQRPCAQIQINCSNQMIPQPMLPTPHCTGSSWSHWKAQTTFPTSQGSSGSSGHRLHFHKPGDFSLERQKSPPRWRHPAPPWAPPAFPWAQ